MTDETLAEAPVAETKANEPVNDGIVDLDAPQEVENEEDEDGEKKPEEAPKPEEKPDEDKPKKLSGAQRAKFREQRLLSENAELQRRLEEVSKSKPAHDASDDKPPREEDFNGDWFAYQRALTAHDAGKAVRDEIRKDREARETSERNTKASETVRQRAEAHAERVEAAREVITDFDQVMEEMKGVNVRNEVIEEIMSSEKSAELTYFLAKNPEKLEAMNAMSARELAREMGRLEATVELPSAKKQTSAPPPLSSVKGGAAPSSTEADLNAWLKKTYPAR